MFLHMAVDCDIDTRDFLGKARKSFFTRLQALGAGSMELGSELMEAPEDEETFDVLNDETFGDIGEG